MHRANTTRKAVRNVLQQRSFTSSVARSSYEDTIPNLKIGKDTRVMFQGFTGKQATANAKDSIAWGTKVVGGVKPNFEGEHLGLPVLPTVKAAQQALKPDATAIYVAATQAAAAIEEAIEAEVPLIVAVAEHIPIHDIMRIHSILQTQSKSRLIGANAPGIISAIGKCRIGFQPLPTYLPGHVGVVAKSGTLGYEAVAALSRAGLGQSLGIAVGGDIMAGTNHVDALKLFENDEDTECIVLLGEVGGRTEEDAVEWITDYKKRAKNPKPIAAVIGGVYARPDKIMGHAGAFPLPGDNLSARKIELLRDAGVTVVGHPSELGTALTPLLKDSGRYERFTKTNATNGFNQKRGFHTSRRTPFNSRAQVFPPMRQAVFSGPMNPKFQRRSLSITTQQAADILKDAGVETSTSEAPSDSHYLSITVDRSNRSPAILVSPSSDTGTIQKRGKKFPYDYRSGPSNDTINAALAHIQLDAAPPAAKAAAASLIKILSKIYTDKEAIDLSVTLSTSSNSDKLQVHNPTFFFDDAAFRSSKRHPELHALRDTSKVNKSELAGEKDGIVYIPLGEQDPKYNIGTLVNGAGLAMNTVDALRVHGGYASNFLDTGGKATSETVKQSFKLILEDPRVKVIFVNIFGGLTLGDMIANGILLAFKELGLQDRGIPIVVRIRGTNEKEGQKIIAESGLNTEAFDDFEEAAKRVVELANKK